MEENYVNKEYVTQIIELFEEVDSELKILLSSLQFKDLPKVIEELKSVRNSVRMLNSVN